MSEKSKAEQLKEQLFLTRKNGLASIDETKWNKITEFCEGYKKFLADGKTERESVSSAIIIAEKAGFKPFDANAKYKAGDKYYVNNRGKTIAFVVVGEKTVDNGIQMTAAHVDSPRIDLKPNPLYEDTELALFKTRYYGGIRKYQWVTMPLALHGVFAKKDGTVVNVSIGEDENEPCFVITDLLPHLAQEQSKRTLSDGIRGEELNILIGSRPFDGEGGELVKLNIMSILNEKYGVTEEDFLSAELECVPAGKPRDIGFDSSLIGAYGHDDRVCAYPALIAITEVEKPEKTAIAILVDKEEIGSGGNTGLGSEFICNIVHDLAVMQGVDETVALRNSKCLSADVNAAVDPTFKDVMEHKNAAKLNYGAVVTKYTGGSGKSGTSDASAEFVAYVRAMLDNAGITWQTGELGRVDLGGGGTVAIHIGNRGIDVVDLGVPVLSMHAPFEVVSKFDVYETYRTMYEFCK